MSNDRIAIRVRPIIRGFVSSTFSNIEFKRDALQQKAFPSLERLCLKDGFQFQAINLRWGISTEAGLDHRTMEICFEGLGRSQEVSPEANLLILRGNRYGWRPLSEEISGDELRNLEEATGQIELADQQQPPMDVRRQSYQLDKNSLTSVYTL